MLPTLRIPHKTQALLRTVKAIAPMFPRSVRTQVSRPKFLNSTIYVLVMIFTVICVIQPVYLGLDGLRTKCLLV